MSASQPVNQYPNRIRTAWQYQRYGAKVGDVESFRRRTLELCVCRLCRGEEKQRLDQYRSHSEPCADIFVIADGDICLAAHQPAMHVGNGSLQDVQVDLRQLAQTTF